LSVKKEERFYYFAELINFIDKIIPKKIQNYYLSYEKYSESSKNSGKILRDIIEHKEPKLSIWSS